MNLSVFHLMCFLTIPSCPGTNQHQTQLFIRKLRQKATVTDCTVLLEAFTSWTKEAQISLINQYRAGAISDIKIDNKSLKQIKYRLDALITSGTIQRKARLYEKSAEKLRSIPQQNTVEDAIDLWHETFN